MPRTVVDAVLARVHRLTPAARQAVEQLAVVPSRVEPALLRALCPDLAPVAEAERLGVLEVRPDAVAFRHELARRAVVESLPVTVRLDLQRAGHRRAARRARRPTSRASCTTPSRPATTRPSSATGPPSPGRPPGRGRTGRPSPRTSRCWPAPALLDPAEHAALLDAHAWSLYNVNRLHDAAAAAAAAVALADRHGGPGADPLPGHAVAPALVAAAHGGRARRRPPGRRPRRSRGRRPASRAAARVNLGAVLVLVDREEEGLPHLATPDDADPALVALAHNYRGSALLQLGDVAGAPSCSTACAAARELGQHEYVMRGYYNLAEGLWRLGRHAEAARYLDAAAEYGRDRDFQAHSTSSTARRQRLRLMRGEWGPGGGGAPAVARRARRPGHARPRDDAGAGPVARPPGRRRAAETLASPLARPGRPTSWSGWCPPAWPTSSTAWLTRPCPTAAADWADLLRARTDRAGAAHHRGELLRWLRRLGEPVVARSRAARPSSRRASPATGARLRRSGSGWAIRTSGRWSCWSRERRSRRWRRSRCSTASAPGPRRRSPGAGCVNSASCRCRAVRRRRPGRTRPG